MIPNSKTFCIAPFKHACVDSIGKLKLCCQSSEKSYYSYDQLEEWYNSKTLQDIRKNLVNGIQDPICKHCWKQEKNNRVSLRQVYNKHIGKIIPQHFEKSFKKNKKLIDIVYGEINHKNIDTFDLQLGNRCNLKCIMCGPRSSSEILIEAIKNKELQAYYKIPESKNFVWPKQKRFKVWCKEKLKKSTHINFTGGEPFLNPYLLDTLENISVEQRKKCTLRFTTNLTIMNKEILDLLKDFKEVWISISIEGIDKVLEYARYGHKWLDLQKNIDYIQNFKFGKIYTSINYVVQSPTFYGIKDLVNHFDNKKIKIEPIFLESPNVFTLKSLKTKYKKEFINHFAGYTGYNLKFINSIVSFVKNNLEYNKDLGELCVKRLQDFDKVRKNNFQDIIPLDYFV